MVIIAINLIKEVLTFITLVFDVTVVVSHFTLQEYIQLY